MGKMITQNLRLLNLLMLAFVFGGLASTANAQQLVDRIKIEAHDAEYDPVNQYGIRLVWITVEGELTESDDDVLGTVWIGGVQVTRGRFENGGHELYGLEGTDILLGDMIEANRRGDFAFTFVLPVNAVGNTEATLDLWFGNEESDLDPAIYDAIILSTPPGERHYQFAVQIPNFTEGDVDDRVYRNGDTIDVELECESPTPGQPLSQGREIEVLTILPDFSNVDSAFAGGNSVDPVTGQSLVPFGRVANDTTYDPVLRRYGRYNLAVWDTDNRDPNALDLYDLILDVDRAMRDGRLVIDQNGGDYDVSYTISDGNANESGRKRVFVHAVDYPSTLSLSIYDMPTIFARSGLAFPDALNIATWRTGPDLGDPPGAEPDADLDSGAPNFDFAVINPFDNPPKARWIDADGDGSIDPDEWVYTYKEGDMISVMVQIDPHDLTDAELDEIDPEDIYSTGNSYATISNIRVVGDISALLDPTRANLITDADRNGIPDDAEVQAQYAGGNGRDDDLDGQGYEEDDEDNTSNGFNERYLFVINIQIDDTFRGVSGLRPATTNPLPIRFMIEDAAGNQTHYSAWREGLYSPDTGLWRTVALAQWDRDTNGLEGIVNPVHVDDPALDELFAVNGYPVGDARNTYNSSVSRAPIPANAEMPPWSPGFRILTNWDQPWRVVIDAAAPSVSRFDRLKLQVSTTDENVGKGAAVVPGVSLLTGGTNVLGPGNFIYEIGGHGLVTLIASFPSSDDVDYVKFIYSDTDLPGSYRAMKGRFPGDVNVQGLYDMAGDWRDVGVPGARYRWWHDGFNGDDDGDGKADLSDREVRDARSAPWSDGTDNDADGLVDAGDIGEDGYYADTYSPERDEDEDGIMDEDEYVIMVDRVTNAASWTFDPIRIARVLNLSPDRVYAIKAVPYDLAGNAIENAATPIYVVFRVTGSAIADPTGTATAQLYRNGEPVIWEVHENYLYDLLASTTGIVNAVAFQYSMDRRIWVNIPTASGQPNPDPAPPFRISWRPTLSRLAADLWVDGDNDGIKDTGEPVYQSGDILYIRSVAMAFGPVLGKYEMVHGLTIDPQYFVPYEPGILPSPLPVPLPGADITTAVSDTHTLVLHLYPGWNLISLSVDPDVPGYELLTILRPIDGLYRSVWTYDALSGNWKRYIPDDPDLPSKLETMEPGKGYWIDMIEEAMLTITGGQIAETTIPLRYGWNLVGYNSLAIQSRQDTLSSIASYRPVIYTYNSATESWPGYAAGSPDFLNSLHQLVPGMGYWIYVEGNCDWTVSP